MLYRNLYDIIYIYIYIYIYINDIISFSSLPMLYNIWYMSNLFLLNSIP